MEKLIAYYRVSTQRQGRSGLGLEAQRQCVQDYARQTNSQIVAELTEIESGKRNDRPELKKAIAKTRAIKGKLIIAKLDRLARNVAFTATLMDSGIEFVCCDMPQANRLTLHIISAVAEDEARRISERTKLALAQAKLRGVKLGTARPQHLEKINYRKGAAKGLAQIKANASKRQAEIYGPILNEVKEMADDGQTLQQIADELNDRGLLTVRGSKFFPNTIKRLLNLLPSIVLA